MVARAFILAALLLPALVRAETAAPAPLSPVADAQANTSITYFQREHLATQTGQPPLEKNSRLEDFAVVGIISLPFTALYSFLGAAIADSVDQNKFPPELKEESLVTAAGVALGSSLLIATFSVDWGSGKPENTPSHNPETDDTVGATHASPLPGKENP